MLIRMYIITGVGTDVGTCLEPASFKPSPAGVANLDFFTLCVDVEARENAFLFAD